MRKEYRSGRVRLTGEDLAELRRECYERDNQCCRVCGVPLYFNARFDGDPIGYEMAHIKSRGAGGSDSLDNVRALCGKDHRAEHQGRP